MKKIIKVVLCLAIFCPIMFSNNVYATETTLKIEGETYSSTINLIYNNDVSTKYQVVENESQFNMEFIHEDSTVIINDKVYSKEDFDNAMSMQAEKIRNEKNNIYPITHYLEKFTYTVNTVDYDQCNLNIKEEFSKQFFQHSDYNTMTRCNQCGYSPNAAPTSGYRAYSSGGGIDNGGSDSFVVSMSGTAVGALAAKLTRGVLSKASGLMGWFIGWVTDGVISDRVKASFKFWQAYHKVCPKACAERRQYYVITLAGSRKYVDGYDYFYFYFLNPYS